MFASLLGGGALLAWTPARAADEEIQVYMDELNTAGQVGLDVHVNDVLAGDGTPDYPGAESSLHRWRVTPEWSLGLGDGFELGAYLPLATIDRAGVLRAEGAKARLKWLAPHGDKGFYWGANLEIGRVAHRVDPNPWNGELKLIAGWRNERWTLAANANVDFVVSGREPSPASLQLATKLGYKVAPDVTLGVESYNGVGDFHALGFNHQEHATFATADFALGKWDFNAGIGKGYGTSADSTIVKFVIGVPI
ncbi:MAG: hypothetical protein J2O44_01400 [Porphyrobacter sp.]|nr:hypothetical protein [Porphyrobacter sp.]